MQSASVLHAIHPGTARQSIAGRRPAVRGDDIVEQLEWHGTCVRNAEGLCLLQQSLYEIKQLRRWKAEANWVLKQWDTVADMVPVRLGDLKSAAVAAEIERLRAEVTAIRAERDCAQIQAAHLAQRLVAEARLQGGPP